jgi:hypothetical protein
MATILPQPSIKPTVVATPPPASSWIDELLTDLARVYFDNTWAAIPDAIASKPYGAALSRAIDQTGVNLSTLLSEVPVKKDGNIVSQAAYDAFKKKYAKVWEIMVQPAPAAKPAFITGAELSLLKKMYYAQHWPAIDAATAASPKLTAIKNLSEAWGVPYHDFITYIPIDKNGVRGSAWEKFLKDYDSILSGNIPAGYVPPAFKPPAGAAAVKAPTAQPNGITPADASALRTIASALAQPETAQPGYIMQYVQTPTGVVATQTPSISAEYASQAYSPTAASPAPAADWTGGIPVWGWVAGGAGVLGVAYLMFSRGRR